jgi:hypothetical protein
MLDSGLPWWQSGLPMADGVGGSGLCDIISTKIGASLLCLPFFAPYRIMKDAEMGLLYMEVLYGSKKRKCETD